MRGRGKGFTHLVVKKQALQMSSCGFIITPFSSVIVIHTHKFPRGKKCKPFITSVQIQERETGETVDAPAPGRG